jgi:hypothetical protein
MRLCETLLRDSVQVPICMSRNCQVFTVIRTVYHIRRVGDRLVSVSSLLPVESIPGEQLKNTAGKLEAFGKKRSELTYKDTHRFRTDSSGHHVRLYWIYLDDSGENLCYATQERPLPNSLRVFRISICTDETLRLEIQLVAERRFWTLDITYRNGEEGKDFEMCFHPFLPIVVYAWAKGTYVWNIATSKLQLSSCSCVESSRPNIHFQRNVLELGIVHSKSPP